MPLRSISRSDLIRIGLLGLTVCVLIALFYATPLNNLAEEDGWLALIDNLKARPAAPFLLVTVFVVLCSAGVPITPMILASGLAYGVWPGALLAYIGIILSALVIYTFARALGYEAVTRILGNHHRHLAKLLTKRSFWTLVRMRYLPIPFLFINLTMALGGVRRGPFVVSTSFAFLPVATVFTYLAASVAQAGSGIDAGVLRDITIALVLMLGLSFLPSRVMAWRRSVRLRELRESRRRRSAAPS